jgi:hypothetical protein
MRGGVTTVVSSVQNAQKPHKLVMAVSDAAQRLAKLMKPEHGSFLHLTGVHGKLI